MRRVNVLRPSLSLSFSLTWVRYMIDVSWRCHRRMIANTRPLCRTATSPRLSLSVDADTRLSNKPTPAIESHVLRKEKRQTNLALSPQAAARSPVSGRCHLPNVLGLILIGPAAKICAYAIASLNRIALHGFLWPQKNKTYQSPCIAWTGTVWLEEAALLLECVDFARVLNSLLNLVIWPIG